MSKNKQRKKTVFVKAANFNIFNMSVNIGRKPRSLQPPSTFDDDKRTAHPSKNSGGAEKCDAVARILMQRGLIAIIY